MQYQNIKIVNMAPPIQGDAPNKITETQTVNVFSANGQCAHGGCPVKALSFSGPFILRAGTKLLAKLGDKFMLQEVWDPVEHCPPGGKSTLVWSNLPASFPGLYKVLKARVD